MSEHQTEEFIVDKGRVFEFNGKFEEFIYLQDLNGMSASDFIKERRRQTNWKSNEEWKDAGQPK